MIRRLALAVALLASLPAQAVEIIGNAPSWAAYAKAAAATGLTDAKGIPLTQGPLGKDGSWFYNAVGDVSVPTGKTTTCTGPGGTVSCPEMQALSGKWVRVRFNGDSPNLPDLIKAWRAFGITISSACRSDPMAICAGQATVQPVGQPTST